MAAVHRDALDGAHIGVVRFADSAELPLWLMEVGKPVLNMAGQAYSLFAQIVFPMHFIATDQQPIDVIQAASAFIQL